MQQQKMNITQCTEGSKTAGQQVSHFYKFEESLCTCVFCGQKMWTTSQFHSLNNLNQLGEIGERS